MDNTSTDSHNNNQNDRSSSARDNIDRPFTLNEVRIDPIANRVTRDGETQDVTPKVIQILQYLAGSGGELVTYQNMADNVWNGFVSESALYQQMTQLRKVLGDNPSKPAFVKTVPRQGYRLIATVAFEEPSKKKATQTQSQSSSASALPWKLITLGAVAATAIIAVLLYPLLTPSNTSDLTAGKNFDAELIYPERTIALELFNRLGKPVQPQLRATLERITEFHLGQQPRQHVLRTPAFDTEFFFGQLNSHLDQRGNLTYILRTDIQETESEVVVDIQILSPQLSFADQQEVGQITTRFERGNLAAGLPEFEQALLNEFQRLSLINPQSGETIAPLLNDDIASNKALLESLSPWASPILNKNTVEEGIAAAERALSLNPNNLIAYSVLFNEISWLLNSFDGDFDIDRTLTTLRERSEQALHIDSQDFKALHAMAAYHCWLDELNQCASWLEKAIALRPYDGRLLRTLEDYLSKTNQSTLPLAKYNYYMHPFTGGSLYYYRNVLVSEGKLSQAIKLVGNHTFRQNWDNWGPVWRLETQKQTRFEQLTRSAQWYKEHYQELQHANPEGIDRNSDTRRQTPSRYLGYQLLNANQPELALYWDKNGRERDSQFFDLNTLSLLAQLWRGDWNATQWRASRDLANNRSGRLNSFDQLRIAFFEYYAGHMNSASKSLLAIYPEFSSEDIDITRDNFRPAIYYAEIQKRQNNYKQAAHINGKLRQYMKDLGNNPERDLDFGIADAEFFALNSDSEKALQLLQQAINERDWLPNAYWLWLPLEQNPFLSSLRNEPGFIALSKQVNTKLAELCFNEEC